MIVFVLAAIFSFIHISSICVDKSRHKFFVFRSSVKAALRLRANHRVFLPKAAAAVYVWDRTCRLKHNRNFDRHSSRRVHRENRRSCRCKYPPPATLPFSAQTQSDVPCLHPSPWTTHIVHWAFLLWSPCPHVRRPAHAGSTHRSA